MFYINEATFVKYDKVSLKQLKNIITYKEMI